MATIATQKNAKNKIGKTRVSNKGVKIMRGLFGETLLASRSPPMLSFITLETGKIHWRGELGIRCPRFHTFTKEKQALLDIFSEPCCCRF